MVLERLRLVAFPKTVRMLEALKLMQQEPVAPGLVEEQEEVQEVPVAPWLLASSRRSGWQRSDPREDHEREREEPRPIVLQQDDVARCVCG